ncbi:hypothetical protein RHSIM_RhsimUnG0128800 [Rhododendron simsii]|uniref:Uncharacterized protein n=1 Tax=Rhododendron simsii TaxID=118357 RepID=A0A834G0W3_RHOSS|nr:hypothetical protein RHSIM_RhsimUnG0128800 [Rhododendron simsii]
MPMELGRPTETGKLDPPTPISKRKRVAPSPTSSANSVIGENSVQVVRDFDADLEAFRKEQGFNSRKKRVFNDLQWRVIYNELLVRTGRTGYTPKKGHPGAAKYRQKGLDHYDQLQELFESSLANGALGQPSSLKPPTSEEEVAMCEVGKAIKREDSVSMGKRKSDGSDTDEGEDADGEQGNVEQINMSAENIALMATRRNEIAQMMWENY